MEPMSFFFAGLFLGLILRTTHRPKFRAIVPKTKAQKLQEELDEVAIS
jgi:hypothetical protein